MTKIKICGLTTSDAIDTAISAGADYLGFVFFPSSPRHMPIERAIGLIPDLPGIISTVVVTVDADDHTLTEIITALNPTHLQLHGTESPDRVRQIKEKTGIPVIKALPIRNADDVSKASTYYDVADMLLFDAKAPETSVLPGGNGLTFDWELLADRKFPLPWFLSGGLNAENVEKAVDITHAPIVDVSSSLESAPGVKDPALIKQFIQKLKG